MGLLAKYKALVKRNPGVVQNLDWLLYLVNFNPSRLSSSGEANYELYHAAIGLLSLFHQGVLEEDELPAKRPSSSVWLDAVEQIETLVELRAMYLESKGKMSRYGPLAVLETVKAVLKMDTWLRYPRHMFLRRPSPEDLHLFESEQGLQDILSALQRLYDRHAHAAEQEEGEAEEAMGDPRDGGGRGQAAAEEEAVACGGGGGGGGGACAACRRADSGAGTSTSGRHLPSHSQQQQQQQQQQTEITPCGAEGPAAQRFPAAAEANGNSGGGHDGGSGSGEWGGGAGLPPSFGLPQVLAANASDAAAALRGFLQLLLPGRVAAGKGGGRGAASPPSLDAADGGDGSSDPDAVMGRNLLWLAELLHIWRPVVYVLLLQRYGRSSWRPWSGSLAVDLLSGHFQQRGRHHLALSAAAAQQQQAAAGGSSHGGSGRQQQQQQQQRTSLLSLALARSLSSPGVTAGEERELFERRRKMLLYLLRPPFLDTFIKSWVDPLRDSTSRVPLLGTATDYLAGLLDTFTQYYTYTSGS